MSGRGGIRPSGSRERLTSDVGSGRQPLAGAAEWATACVDFGRAVCPGPWAGREAELGIRLAQNIGQGVILWRLR